ncbi:hypothetical protein V5O48_019045, partial [Marasmius crinis-equi]
TPLPQPPPPYSHSAPSLPVRPAASTSTSTAPMHHQNVAIPSFVSHPNSLSPTLLYSHQRRPVSHLTFIYPPPPTISPPTISTATAYPVRPIDTYAPPPSSRPVMPPPSRPIAPSRIPRLSRMSARSPYRPICHLCQETSHYPSPCARIGQSTLQKRVRFAIPGESPPSPVLAPASTSRLSLPTRAHHRLAQLEELMERQTRECEELIRQFRRDLRIDS